MTERQQRMQQELIEFLKGERDWIYSFVAAGELARLGKVTGEFEVATAHEWMTVIERLTKENKIESKGGEIRFLKVEPPKAQGNKQLELF